ncbi:aldehyde dehydrogenase family protein [Sulfuricurvum sp.]|uniref:aldehyde dehydrogenase family protein n=1 Tax=Sulfuricurvum sp. TaxID=2025608 RepID=UPI00261D5D44|nr:aldehyde dehydrogenase family protein [Sulfuricurvum sp.]MDD3597302.1 aldehyde dehydrogenase family protein [Sulfuricurvum sp.]
MKEYMPFINGKNKPSHPGKVIDDVNPATGAVFAKVHLASPEDIEEAISTAYAASKLWAKTTPREKEAVLLKAADIFESRTDEIRTILMRESGSVYAKAMFEIGLVTDILRVAAGEARRVFGQTFTSNDPGVLSYSTRRPLGVIAGISPFNAPMILSTKKFAMAIAAGNAFVLKPSSHTPICGLIFGEIFKEAGLPDGVLNIIPCSSGDLGETFQSDPRIAMITLTGSTRVGKLVAASAAMHLKKCTVELGGKSPMIVLGDADIDYAVDTAIFSIFLHQGQICMAGSRIIVEADIYDAFCEKFAAKVKMLKVGNPEDPTTIIGPLIEEAQCRFIDGLIDDALYKGATLLSGREHEGCFYKPTVIADVTEEMVIFHEEAFGPAAAIIKARDIDHVIELANNSTYGLSSSVITDNLSAALKLSEEIESGMVHINGPTIQDEAHIPFGGVKESGMGREGGHFAIEEMTELKWVTVEAAGNRSYPF